VVAAAPAPFSGRAPELVVEQPLTCPGEDGGGDSIAMRPLAGLVETEAAVWEGVRKVAVVIDNQPGAAYCDERMVRWRVLQTHKIWVADVGRLEFSSPSQCPRFQFRGPVGIVLAQ